MRFNRKNYDHISYIHVFLIIRRNGIYCKEIRARI